MQPEQITADLRVAYVLRRWPDAYQVFCRFGCPDMRRGFFSVMARIMRLRWAARVHRIPIGELLDELNACVRPRTVIPEPRAAHPPGENRGAAV
jgi:hypothetical protein